MAQTQAVVNEVPVYIPATRDDFWRVGLLGLIAGLASVLVSKFIANYIIDPIWCHSTDHFAICSTGGTVAFNIAAALVAIATTVVMARLNTFRPLLIALFGLVSFWSLNEALGALSWWEFALWGGLLFGLGYLLFFWLMRSRSLAVCLGLGIISVVVIRLLLSL